VQVAQAPRSGILQRPEEHCYLVHIIVQPNESIDSALKRFNLKLQQSGVLRELKEHAHYEKPSEKRRRQRRRRVGRS
jgi:small subunit ribosomal protein S21